MEGSVRWREQSRAELTSAHSEASCALCSLLGSLQIPPLSMQHPPLASAVSASAAAASVDSLLACLLQANLAVDALQRDAEREVRTHEVMLEWMERKAAEADAAAAAYSEAEREAAAAAASAPRVRSAPSAAAIAAVAATMPNNMQQQPREHRLAGAPVGTALHSTAAPATRPARSTHSAEQPTLIAAPVTAAAASTSLWTPLPVAGAPTANSARPAGRRQYTEHAHRPTLLSDADQAARARVGLGPRSHPQPPFEDDSDVAVWTGPLPTMVDSASSASSAPDEPSGLFGAAPKLDKAKKLSPYLQASPSGNKTKTTRAGPASATKLRPKPGSAQKPAAARRPDPTSAGSGAGVALSPVALDLASILRLAGRAHVVDDADEGPTQRIPRRRLPPPPPPPPAQPSPSPAPVRALTLNNDFARDLADCKRLHVGFAALLPGFPPSPSYPIADADRSAIKAELKATQAKKKALPLSDAQMDAEMLRRVQSFEAQKADLFGLQLLAAVECESASLLQPLLAPATLRSLSTPSQLSLLRLAWATLNCGGHLGARERYGRPRRAMPSFLPTNTPQHAQQEDALPQCMTQHHLWSAEEEERESEAMQDEDNTHENTGTDGPR